MTNLQEVITHIEALRDDAAKRQNMTTTSALFSPEYWGGKRDGYDNVLHLLRDAAAVEAHG